MAQYLVAQYQPDPYRDIVYCTTDAIAFPFFSDMVFAWQSAFIAFVYDRRLCGAPVFISGLDTVCRIFSVLRVCIFFEGIAIGSALWRITSFETTQNTRDWLVGSDFDVALFGLWL